MRARIESYLETAKKNIKSIEREAERIEKSARGIASALKAGRQLIIAGNGGSAADAQHIAAEFVGRFRRERKPYAAVALNTNTSILTAVGNDYSFDEIFSRQIEAIGRPGDVFLAITTSGNSANIIKALESARQIGMTSILLSGGSGGRASELSDIVILPDTAATSHIQECHLIIYHMICSLVEDEIG